MGMKVKLGDADAHFRTVSYDRDKDHVCLIDQRVLPHDFKILSSTHFEETADAIRDMVVRGAGAIGATAAYGFAQGIRQWEGGPDVTPEFNQYVRLVFDTLGQARPTAVDPMNALKWMLGRLNALNSSRVSEWKETCLQLAEQFASDNVEDCQAIGRHGEPLIREGMNILTHCNAGWLAFVDFGSATAPVYSAWDAGKRFHVYCDETRPRLQGAALTAWELFNHGVDHTVIADNAAGFLMSRGKIDMVITGSDRVIAATGEVANKIGTFTKAVLAHHHKIPFYVAIPTSTLDWELQSGTQIPIEERSEQEIHTVSGIGTESGAWESVRITNPGSPASNYGFDITPPELITGIITPAGIFKPDELMRLQNSSSAADPT